MNAIWDASERREPLVECKCGAKARRFFGTGMLSREPVCETCYRNQERVWLLERRANEQTGAA